MAGARDHTPDSKAACASTTARWTSSELAASTLQEVSYVGGAGVRGIVNIFASLSNEGVPTNVQMCNPVAGFVTENLRGALSEVLQRFAGPQTHSSRGSVGCVLAKTCGAKGA